MPNALERDHDRDEDDGEDGQQDGQGNLVRRLLPVGALDQRDHAVEERLSALGRDTYHDPVREHPGSASDRRSIASRFPDDRRRLAGDGRFVDRGDALDDLAVGGDQVVGLADDDVSLVQLGGRYQLLGPVGVDRRASVSERIRRRVSACALPRPSAIASAKLAKITVRKSQTVMDQVKAEGWAMASMKVTMAPPARRT